LFFALWSWSFLCILPWPWGLGSGFIPCSFGALSENGVGASAALGKSDGDTDVTDVRTCADEGAGDGDWVAILYHSVVGFWVGLEVGEVARLFSCHRQALAKCIGDRLGWRSNGPSGSSNGFIRF
jgi:hypothetical protein